MSGVPKDEGPSLFVQSLPGSFSDLGPLGADSRLYQAKEKGRNCSNGPEAQAK